MSLAPRPGSTGPIITLSWRNVYSVIIALLPVLMAIRVPFVNKGLSTILIGITVPIAISSIISNRQILKCLPIIVFLIYIIIRVRSNSQSLFLIIMVSFHALGAMNNSINSQSFRKTVEIIAIIGTFCILVQYFIYLTLDIRFCFIHEDFLLKANQHKAIEFRNGLGMFRPAAFFLEPAHYSQYCSIAILSLLFPYRNESPKLGKALWVSIGIILTTSGIGFVLTFCIFIWYIIFSQNNNISKSFRIIEWVLIGLCLFLIFTKVPFFKSIISRFTDNAGTTNNAIFGRTLFWDTTVGSLHGKDLIFGVGPNVKLADDTYLTGIMDMIFHYGIIGYSLLIICIIYIVFLGHNNFTACSCIIYIGIIFVADVTGFINLIYWLSLIISSIPILKISE